MSPAGPATATAMTSSWYGVPERRIIRPIAHAARQDPAEVTAKSHARDTARKNLAVALGSPTQVSRVSTHHPMTASAPAHLAADPGVVTGAAKHTHVTARSARGENLVQTSDLGLVGRCCQSYDRDNS